MVSIYISGGRGPRPQKKANRARQGKRGQGQQAG